MILILLSSCNKGKVDPKTVTEEAEDQPTAKPARSIKYPAEQVSFHETNLRFRDRLRSAKNDIQRSAVVTECDKARTQFFKEIRFRLVNWVGKVADIGFEKKGDWAFMKIESDVAGFPVSYQTHYQRWPVSKGNSILIKGTKAYQQASRLSIGEMVSFSGTIIGSLYYKYSEFNSLDVESVHSPKIIVQFNDITPFAPDKE